MFIRLLSKSQPQQVLVLLLTVVMLAGLCPVSKQPLTNRSQRGQGLIRLPGNSLDQNHHNATTDVKTDFTVGPTSRATVADVYRKSRLAFEPVNDNTGFGPEFVARGIAYNVALTSAEATVSFSQPDEHRSRAPKGSNEPHLRRTVLGIRPLGVKASPQPEAIEELPGKSNYLIGANPSNWRTNVPTFAKVKYANLYSGVDVIYYGTQQQLEYDFVIKPGTDPGIIRLAFDGVDKISLDAGGDLILQIGGIEIRHQRPVVYQASVRGRQEIEAEYVLRNGKEIAFQVGRYDKAKPLTIDPVFIFSGFLGGARAEAGYGIATDSAGNCYITGSTDSLDFPVAGALDASFGGTNDAFLTKISPAGQVLSSTYLGGTGNDSGQDVVVDSAGNIFVGGFTSGNFPVLNGVEPIFHGGYDCFVVKLDPSASVMLWGTYLGGSRDEAIPGSDNLSLAVDQAGNVFVTGRTNSADFVVVNAFQSTIGGNFDAFLSKISSDGSTLLFSTYIGGAGEDDGLGVAVDSAGEAFVTGVTFSSNFPTVNALDNSLGGSFDAFVLKFAANGASLIFATYLGGSDQEDGFGGAIALDSQGFCYVTGSTGSSDFQTVLPIQATNHGSHDIFVTKINPSGSAIVYSTFWGGSGTDAGLGIAVDQSGNAWVVGFSSGTDFPLVNALDSTRGGSSDAVILKINSAGTATLFASYYGGSSQETGNAIAMDQSNSAYITGVTTSADLTIVSPLQPVLGGNSDAFVARIFDAPMLSIAGISPNRGGNNGFISAVVLGAGFQDGAIVRLVKAGLPDINGTQVVTIDSNRITATFDLHLMAPGARDIVVVNPNGATATLPAAFTVEEGGTTRVWADLIGRTTIRSNTVQIYTLAYGNAGNINAPAPLLELSSPDSLQFGLFDGLPLQDGKLRIFAGGQGGPAGVLPPGSYSMQVAVVTPAASGRLKLDLSIIQTQGQSFDWNLLADQGAPAGSDLADWHERVSRAHALIGDSLEDVMNALRTRASESKGDVSSFYNFDQFMRYAVGIYGATETPATTGSRTTNKAVITRSHHAKPHGGSASLQGVDGPRLLAIADHDNPTETIVIFHGAGGLFGLDGNRTDFLNAAAAIAHSRPGANVYVFDWTSDAQERLVGNIINPWKVASHIEGAGNAAFALLSEKQARHRLEPSRTTLIGESDGALVMDFAAARFVADGLGKIQHGLALDTPSVLNGHKRLPAFKLDFQHSESVITPSFFDSTLKDADHTLLYQTTKTRPDQQHTDAIKAVILNPDFFLNLASNTLLRKSINPLESDGRITTIPSYDPIPYVFLFDAVQARLLSLMRQLLRSITVFLVNSQDPNEKTGTLGAGDFHYLSALRPLEYLVSFENVATATAPAQTVVIRDQLDITNDNLNTVSLGPINFGNRHLVPPPGFSDYVGSVDLRPGVNLIVKVEVNLNKQTGLLTWTFKSLNPLTGLPVDDPTVGFLPPNTNPPQGEGSVFFTVSPRSVPTDTQISNAASIVFDNNAAIQTNVWSNKIDASVPQSQITSASVTPCSPSIAVAWGGTDFGAGLQTFSVYVSDNGGSFNVWQQDTVAQSGNYVGEFGHTYAFYSIAQDVTGNVEEKHEPDIHITINPPAPPTIVSVPPRVVRYTGSGANTCNVLIGDAALGTIAVASECPVTISRAGIPAGNLFPIGNTTITYNVTDAFGNRTSATQTVSVIDNTPPVLVTPATINVTTASSCRVAIPDLVAQSGVSDNCAGLATVIQNPTAGTLVGPGTHAIALTAIDASGNLTSHVTNLIVNGATSLAVSITPAVVKRGGSVTATLSFSNCSSTRQIVTLKVSLTTPQSSTLMLTLPVIFQANQQGSLSVPLPIPRQTPTGLYTVTLDYFVSGVKIGTTTAQLTVTN